MKLRPSTSSRRRASLAVAATTAVLSGSLLATTVPATAATSFWAGFESGTTSVFSGDSNADVDASCARVGSYGADVSSTLLTPGYLTWSAADVTQGMRYARVQAWVRIDDATDGLNVPLLTVKNANGYNHFDLWRDASTGRLRYDLYRGDHAYSTSTVDVGEWHRIEVLVDFGGDDGSTYSAQVQVDGVDQPSIESDWQVGTTVRSFWFGGPSLGLSNSRCYDAVSSTVSDTPLDF